MTDGEAFTRWPPDQVSTALADRYRLERELGRGGMTTVFLVQDLKHHDAGAGGRCALVGVGDSPLRFARFFLEAI